ncbi:hypothetical protein ACA910_021972 [Epithemia clementina (nom. ined.)]
MKAPTCFAISSACLLVMANASLQPVQGFAVLPSSSSSATKAIPSSSASSNNKKKIVTSPLGTASIENAPRGGGAFDGGGTATIPNEVFNLVKSIIGSGVLSLPYGVAYYGNAPSALIPAVLIVSAMGGLSAYTFGLIGRVCKNTNTMSYSDAWDAAVGKRFSPLIAFSCFFDCFAGVLSYSMILADSAVNLLAGVGVAVSRTQALLAITSTILLPLCLMKNLSSLAPFSLVGIVSMLYITLAMGVRYFGQAYAPGGAFFASQLAQPSFGQMGAKSALSLNALILTCMLTNAYIAHFNAPKFLAELKDNTMGRFSKVIAWSFGISVAIYAAATSFGFLTFGAACNGFILNNYSVRDKLMSLASIAVTISITTSYPLIFVGACDGLLDMVKIPQAKRDNALRNKVTLGVLGVTTLMASQLTDLGLVASLGGATFGTALVFVYPVIMFLKQQKQRTAETIPATLIGILGLVCGAIATVLSLKGVV